jgi:hypothetical protein
MPFITDKEELKRGLIIVQRGDMAHSTASLNLIEAPFCAIKAQFKDWQGKKSRLDQGLSPNF